jgi:HEPN domain-containing protein
MSRYQDWLRQAENDLAWGRHSLDGSYFAQVCFIAQHSGEKALKAYCFAPFELLTREQAERALRAAQSVYDIVSARLATQ